MLLQQKYIKQDTKSIPEKQNCTYNACHAHAHIRWRRSHAACQSAYCTPCRSEKETVQEEDEKVTLTRLQTQAIRWQTSWHSSEEFFKAKREHHHLKDPLYKKQKITTHYLPQPPSFLVEFTHCQIYQEVWILYMEQIPINKANRNIQIIRK